MAGTGVVLLAAAVLAAVSCLASGWLRGWLARRDIVDRPNARSSHHRPTPRGGGLAVVPLVALAWALGTVAFGADPALGGIAALAVALAALSFRDDLKPMPVGVRLAAQAAAVGAGLTLLGDAPVLGGAVPLWADRLLAGLAWLWFVNLFNFMDGIDALAGVEALVIALGLVAVAWLQGAALAVWWPPLALAAAVAGFLVWNWPPARLFLGDAGSVGLGFLLGWLLLERAAAEQGAVALILPAYFGADASLTLLKRLFRGAKIWQAHREHAYQRAVRAGRSHAWVVAHVGTAGAGLIACALVAAGGTPGAALLAAAGLTVALLWRLRAPGC